MFDKIGLLDESFSPGGCEDIDFIKRLEEAGFSWEQVPDNKTFTDDSVMNLNAFPIYHEGSATFRHIDNYRSEIVRRNGLVVLKRFNKNICLNLNPFFYMGKSTVRIGEANTPSDIVMSPFEINLENVSEIYSHELIDFVAENDRQRAIDGWLKVLKIGGKLHLNSKFLGQTTMVKTNTVVYSIIIPTYNHLEDCLKPCIESIIKYTDLSNVEVIVVANGCTDGTKEYVKSLGDPFKLVWFDEALGYARPPNEGIKASSGEYIIFLNNDTVLLPQPKNLWIDQLSFPFKDDPKVGATGPLKIFDRYSNREVLITFCAMVKRSVINEIGLLDEVFNYGSGEDIDFMVRLQNAGYKQEQVPDYNVSKGSINVGQFPLYHKGGVTWADILRHDPKNREYSRRNGLLNMKKYNRNIKLTFDVNAPTRDMKQVGPLIVSLDMESASVLMDPLNLDFDEGTVQEIHAGNMLDTIEPKRVKDVLDNWLKTLVSNGKLFIESERLGKFTIEKTSMSKNSIDTKPKVYDCFPFFNELDLLEIRLNELDPYVDKFVLSEMTLTHSGQPKPLYFLENKQRFEKFLHKIIHVVIENPPKESDPWIRERFQRDFIAGALASCKENDLIIVSDLDEIPRGSEISSYKSGIMYFEQQLYNFYLNLHAGKDRLERGVFSKILTYGELKKRNISLTDVRYYDCTENDKIVNGGWHFRWTGGAQNIVHKLESWAHQEWNLPKYKDLERISTLSKQGVDFFDRNMYDLKFCDIDNTFPKFIQDNILLLVSKGLLNLDPISYVAFQHKGREIGINVYDKHEYISIYPKLYRKFYEQGILDFILNKYPNQKTIVDIGANIGNHAKYFENFINYSRMICFEPDQNNFEILCTNIGLSKTIAYNVALGDRVGRCGLRYLEEANSGQIQVVDGDSVDMCMLDMFGLNDVTLIKIDVEGFELNVLKGAKETILRCKPVIFMERTDKQAEEFLKQLGYNIEQEFHCEPPVGEFVWRK